MAIALADSAGGFGNAGQPPPSQAFTTAASIGDVLVCSLYLNQSGSPGAQTVSDSVDTGNWTLLNSQLDTGSSSGLYQYFKVANAAGTPTVSVSQATSRFGHLCIARFIGFPGTPTADSSLATNKFNAASTTAVSCSPVTTDFNNELLLASNFTGSSFYSSGPSGWTSCSSENSLYYAVVPTSGTNASFVGTLNAAIAWQAIFAGISGSGCTHGGYTSGGAIATPNGSSGSYLGNAGAFVTPNCSSTQYWQPGGGKFGSTLLVPMAPLAWIIARRKLMGRK